MSTHTEQWKRKTIQPTAKRSKRPPDVSRVYERRGFRKVIAAERAPKAGEWYVGLLGAPTQAREDGVTPRAILERTGEGQA